MSRRRVLGVLLAAGWFAAAPPVTWAGGRGIDPFPGQPLPHWAAAPAAGNQAGSGWLPTIGRRAILGLALVGSGSYLIKKGFDYHQQADVLYDRYLNALDPTEISLLYQRTNKRDLKSKVSWTAGTVMAAAGLHMAFGRQLAALHLDVAPPFAGAIYPGARLKLSRNF